MSYSTLVYHGLDFGDGFKRIHLFLSPLKPGEYLFNFTRPGSVREILAG